MSADDSTATVTASCPGKVLVAGGYAILERPNLGLVLSTTARFHTTVREAGAEDGPVAAPSEEEALSIAVISPQYRQELAFSARRDAATGQIALRQRAGPANKYVHAAIAFGTATACALGATLESAHDLEALLSDRDGCLDQLSFADILDVLQLHVIPKPCAFTVGDVRNDSASNQRSLLVLAAAARFGVDDATTVRLWGEHARAVAADPSGTSHANLRAFMQGGHAAVTFGEEDPLLWLSAGAVRLAQDRTTTGGRSSGPATGPARDPCGGHAAEATWWARQSGRAIHVKLCADNDFYSQRAYLEQQGLAYTAEALAGLPPFLPCCGPAGEAEVAKTGLGSSAAMVTSVVSALTKFLVPSLVLSAAVLDRLHAAAQLTHTFMQGKIGSGFDVCAAVHGSMRYVRFEPAALEAALEGVPSLAVATTGAEPQLAEVRVPRGSVILDCTRRLNHVVEPFELPPRLELMCGDVCGGSETPSMSRKILAWKAAAPPDELALWTDLLSANSQVADDLEALARLAAADPADYNTFLDAAAREGWEAAAAVAAGATGPADGPSPITGSATAVVAASLRAAFMRARHCLREIGRLAQVPVEPPCQTALCDATMARPGVAICGVPGAGGFDAVFAVVVDVARPCLAKSWAESTCALPLAESRAHPGLLLAAGGPPTRA